MPLKPTAITLTMLALAFVRQSAPAAPPPYPWRGQPSSAESVGARIEPPGGFSRRPAAADAFATWLRGLPLKPGTPPVHLFDGRLKGNQSAHAYVLDIDVGATDLQQCADAVIRLRAEYLRAVARDDRIVFHFTNGDAARWREWQAGSRPIVRGTQVRWQPTAHADDSYRSFRNYLDTVFTYAGTASLAKELTAVTDESRVEAGDVFIQGGAPGHAVMVVDVADNARGERVFLLAQSYMPAQEMQILVNPDDRRLSPWYRPPFNGPLRTPEWTFPAGSLKRFPSR